MKSASFYFNLLLLILMANFHRLNQWEFALSELQIERFSYLTQVTTMNSMDSQVIQVLATSFISKFGYYN